MKFDSIINGHYCCVFDELDWHSSILFLYQGLRRITMQV